MHSVMGAEHVVLANNNGAVTAHVTYTHTHHVLSLSLSLSLSLTHTHTHIYRRTHATPPPPTQKSIETTPYINKLPDSTLRSFRTGCSALKLSDSGWKSMAGNVHPWPQAHATTRLSIFIYSFIWSVLPNTQHGWKLTMLCQELRFSSILVIQWLVFWTCVEEFWIRDSFPRWPYAADGTLKSNNFWYTDS